MLQGSFPVQTAQLEYKVHEPYLLPHLKWNLDMTFGGSSLWHYIAEFFMYLPGSFVSRLNGCLLCHCMILGT